MSAPTDRESFDAAYRQPLTLWGDLRIPPELKELAKQRASQSSLELGCGLGRFSRYLSRQGMRATGVDWSQVAVTKAQRTVAGDALRPQFLVGDVTNLNALAGPFDFSFDVGCFHCLDAEAQKKYASEIFRLLKPGGIHLIWGMDSSPSGIPLSPAVVDTVFAPRFKLQEARPSRRRFARSHWYWLVRS